MFGAAVQRWKRKRRGWGGVVVEGWVGVWRGVGGWTCPSSPLGYQYEEMGQNMGEKKAVNYNQMREKI